MSKKNNKKNSTRKNYKIEALEPRLMMDAAPVIDFTDPDVVESQLAELYTESENQTATAVSNQVQSIVFQMKDSADQSLAQISDLLKNVETNVKNLVNASFDDAKAKAEAYINEFNSNPDLDEKNKIHSVDTSIFLGYVQDYIKANANQFTVNKIDGSTIDIVYKYGDSLNLNELGLNLNYLEKFASVNGLNVNADISFSLNLNSDNNGVALENANDIAVSVSIDKVSAKIDNLGSRTKFMNIEVNEVLDKAEKTPDLEIDLSSGNVKTGIDFEFDIDTTFLPFKFKSGKYLEVSGTDLNDINVSFPEVDMKDNLVDGEFSLDGLLKTAIGVSQLPFLKEFEIPFNGQPYDLTKVADIVREFNDYWARASVALNGVVDDAQNELDVTNLKSFFDILCQNKANEIDKIFNTIKLHEANKDQDFVCLYANPGLTTPSSTLTSPLGLSDDINNPTTLTLELKPNLGNFTKEIDFNLFKLKDFDIDATLKVDVQVYLDNGTLKFKEISLNDFVIKLTKPFTNENVHIGLFDTKLSGTFDYTIKIGTSGLKESTVVLSCDDIELKSGNVTIYKKPTGSTSLDFKFNMVESVWEFPDDLKQYFALSGETLANNVGIYLNSLRTSLRSLVEDRVKLNFLGDSAGSLVAETIANIDKVLYGGKVQKKGGTFYDVEGLFKDDNGSLKANFVSVEKFRDVFNTAWKEFFPTITGMTAVAEPCSLKYVGATGTPLTEADYESLDDAEKLSFGFQHYILTFTLNFGIDKTLNLNLVDALGNSFANVSTYGAVHAGGEAGINFSLDVNFKHENLKSDTTLGQFWKKEKSTDPISKNETYVDGTTSNYIDGTVVVSVINKDKKEIDTLTINSSSLAGTTTYPQYSNKKKAEYYLEDNQVVITCGDEFDLCATEGSQQNYGELRLGASTLQTTVTTTIAVKSNVSQWKNDLILSFGSGKSLKIPQNVLSDLVGEKLIESAETDSSAKLKDLLNQYFNLQYNSDLAKELKFNLGMIDSSDSIVIGEGRTIMNTFGLYVVSVEGNVTSGFKVRFGCDEKRIQDYGDPEFAGGDTLVDGGKTTYMRVSGALKTTGVVGSEIGLMLEKYSLDASGDLVVAREYVDLSTLTELNSDNLYVDASVAKSKLEEKIYEKDVASGEFLHKLASEYEVRVTSHEMSGGSSKKESIGISAKKSSAFIYKVDGCTLTKYRVKDGSLITEKTVDISSYKLSGYATSDDAEDYIENEKFDEYLISEFGDGFSINVASNGKDFDIEIASNYASFYNSIFSSKFMTISSGLSSIHVDTSTCRDLPSLAQTIKNIVEDPSCALNKDVNSIGVQEDKIVFALATGSSITCSGLGIDPTKETSADFEVNGKEVDFDDLRDASGSAISIGDSTKLAEIVDAINLKLKNESVDVTLNYSGLDAGGNPADWDHLEFHSKNPFDIESVGLSRVLEQLGFSNKMSAVQYGTDDFRIVGHALLGADWSKLIDFTADADLDVFANATLEVGQDFDVSGVGKETDYDNKNYFIYKFIPDADKPNPVFEVNGFVKNGAQYYRIIEVIYDSDNKETSLKISKFAETAKNDSSKNLSFSATQFRYMSGAVATVGFVDVDLVASGNVGFNAKFKIRKATEGEVADALNYKLTVESPIAPTGELKIESFVDIGDKISEKIGDASIALNSDGILDVKNNSSLEDVVNKVLTKFSNFTAEDLFAVLDSLVKRIRDIADKSNVKIPVINKSVSDLVNVAENICDIVNKLRSDKIMSLQGINDRLNKYLIDYGLLAHTDGKINSALNPFVIEIADKIDNEGNVVKVAGTEESVKVLKFSFNIDKSFKAVHQFSFGSGKGISGNADLDVTGDFWLSLCGQAEIGVGSFDLVLTDDVNFGASVNILGEKLSFNLGLDNITDENLLANLITVGSNSGESCVKASAALTGSYSISGKPLSIKNLDKQGKIKASLKVTAYGELPVSVANFALGSIHIGKSNNSNAVYGYDVDVDESWYKIDYEDERSASFGVALITAKDDYAVDENKNKFVVDMSEVYTKISDLVDGNIGWFEKIKLAITGFNTLFDTLEAQLNDGMMKNVKSVPVVGSALSGGVDFLGNLKRKVLEPFSDFVYETSGMTAEMVAEKLNELFGKNLKQVTGTLDLRGAKEAWNSVDSNGKTYYREGGELGKRYAEWYLCIGDTYSLGTDIGLDLGFPGLGLKSDAGVNLGLSWYLNFGFGVSEDGGFYFIFNDGDEVHVSADVTLSGDIMGSLAGLGLDMKVKPNADGSKQVSLAFGVDLNAEGRSEEEKKVNPKQTGDGLSNYGSKDVKVSNLTLKNIDFSYGADVNFTAGITVGIVSDVKSDDNPPKFPNLDGDLVFKWSSVSGEIEELAFKDFKLDMGSFIGGVLGPIVSKIQKVVEPLESLIDFLTTPFPVLDDLGIEITPLSLAKQYSKGKFDDGMVYAVKDIIEMSKKITKFSTKDSVKIDLGSMTLVGKGSGDADTARKMLAGGVSNTSLDKTFNDYMVKVDAATGKVLKNDFSSVASSASSTLSSAGLSMGNSSWRFVWDNPTDVFKLLLGQDIALVEYDMPKLTFSFDWSTFIRIYGPLGARLGLSLGADINLGFGYDTLGIRQWIGTSCKDFGCLLNGFYVNDLRDGVDVDELSFHGALTAAAELNAGVSAGVGGGVGINVGFNLYDPNKDGKIRLGEMTQMFKEDGLFGFFDVSGKITAKLYAYVDLLFYTKEWNITGDKTLFEFKNERKSYPVMISKSGDDVVANIGTNAANRISTNGVNKTLSDDDEILYLKVDGEKVSDDYEHSETIDKGKLIINAEKGNDKIYIVSNGADAKFDIIINGGDGDDIIDLSGLNVEKGHYVLITGGAGADNIIGAHGLNIIFGDEGVLRVDDEKNDDGFHKAYRFVASSNVDANNAGGDFVLGGSGHDIIFGGAGDDKIDGGDGVDYIFGDGGSWSVKTSLTALGKNADETIDLALGDIATAYGGYGNSIDNISKDDVSVTRTDISLDGGADILVGGAGNDMIYGGAGNDHIDGGADDDTIYGERGHDRILGGSDDDTISGGQGMDIIFGDRIERTDVAESFAVDSSSDEKKVAAFSKEFIDAQFKNGSSKTTQMTQGEFEFEVKKLDEKGNVSSLELKSQDSGYGNDTINGDEGNDLIFGDGGADSTNGGSDTIYGGLGNDIIDGDGGSDTLKGGIDNDIIYGGDGDDIIDGGAGNDSLYGDNGVTDYKTKKDGAKDVIDAEELEKNGLGGNKLVFGDNLGLHGKIYENAKSNGAGGNDKITTGPGMDFVDGQGGSDRITVKLMGDDSTNYANITDSGSSGMDSLFVEGTETDDQILVRMNEDKTLGFVALLPVDKEEESKTEKDDADSQEQTAGTTKKDDTPVKQKNSNIERVNIIKSNNENDASLGINVLNVNANGGNDNIYVDGTVETTNIDGGAGNDNFIVGQLYNSKRTTDETSARIQAVDVFHSVATNEESYLSDGVTDGTKLNLEGGSGSDGFVALNNVGVLNMSGGKDDDQFSIYSFRQSEKNADKTYKAFERGAVLIDGGKGNDTLNIRGTDDDDTFVVTKEGMLSDLVAVKAAGVESTQFDAAAGDDMFHVLSNNAGDVTELNGGKGNDTFSMGGLDKGIDNLRSANTDGQNVELTYEIVGGEDADELNKGQSQKESFTLVDTDTDPAVFILEKNADNSYHILESADLFIEKEGVDTVFYVGCAGLKNGETITVEISAPMLSNMDFGRGDRGFVVMSDQNGSKWETTTKVLLSGSTPVAVHVKALVDDLMEEGSRKSIAISSTWSNGDKLLTKSVTSVGVTFAGEDKDAAVASLESYPFAYTEEFVYNGNNEFKMNSILDKIGDDEVDNEISIYVNGEKPSVTATVGENGVITVAGLTANTNDKIVISVRTSALLINDSRVSLAYEGAEVSAVKVDGKEIGTFVSGCKQYYELNGNVITFYNGLTGQPMTMHGVVTVEGVGLQANYDWENYTGASTAAPIHSTSGGFLTISTHDYVLTETMSNDDADSSDEDADPSSGAVTPPAIDFTSQTYDITYNDAKSIADGKKVYVKITPAKLLANSSDVTEYPRLSISCDDSIVDADGSITVYFDNTTDTRTITVTAVRDDKIDDYGLTSVGKQAKEIEPIDGAVYAYGYGKSMELDTGNPAMLKYNHVIESGNNPERAVKYNELNNFESGKLFEIVDNASSAETNVVEINFSPVNPEYIPLLKSIGFDLPDDFDWNDYLENEDLMNAFLDQFKHKTFKWVAEIEKDVSGKGDEPITQRETVVAAKWVRVESADYNDGNIALVLNESISIPEAKNGKTVKKALVSRNRDSIFVDEMVSVDRLFVNNQEDVKDHLGENASSLNAFSKISGNISTEERTAIADNPEIENKDALIENLGLAENRVMEFDSNALRFNHSDIGSRGIAAAQMEYGEYNLGSGKDCVEINKTIYRDDAYRTYTVVNTGDSNNKSVGEGVGTATVTTSSYNSGVFRYNIETSDLWKNASYDSSAIYYVDAEIVKLKSGSTTEYESTGAIQRRQVVNFLTSENAFAIKYDFILAEGEKLGKLTFTQAEFDDEIVVNSYQSDALDNNSTKICSGTNVSKNVSAPAEDSAATEAPAATEETGSESESSAADTSAETETTGEEGSATADAEKPAGPSGNVYSFTMNADDLSQFKNKYAGFGTAKKAADEFTEGEGQNQKTRTRDTNAYAFNLYVDATMSDGSVQRRVVNGMTENTFGIDRDFTITKGVSIVSVKFAYGYEGDGQLVINAQSGNDKIDASSETVTRNDMVVFGGFGDDYITMNKGGIAFGDRGQVTYENGKVNGVDVGRTVLGSTDGDGDRNGGLDYTTGISKNHGDDTEANGPEHRLQTDGVNRDAKEIRSMDDSNLENGIDLINVGGTNSVVIGGDKADVIVISGDKNVALGDNGRVEYNNATNNDAVYGDQLGLGMHKVETTSDAVGDVDNIVIAGNKNVAMGGDKGDSIRITGADNVAIGDAGRYTIERDRLYAESKKESDHIGGQDYISTGDGKNAVIG
ncbi:calcium-binding protein, partial [Candidatus Saccharibacteria bacterium]|nr:calcium-binding protein [Candidatus Saccharibacteria bacterium]